MKIEREHSPLNREVWIFYYLEREHTLRCSDYWRETRPTTRHKHRIEEHYQSHYRSGLELPPLPDDVVREAITQFTAGLTVTTWPPSKR